MLVELIPVPLKHLQRLTLANHGVEMGWGGQLWTWVRGCWSSDVAISVPDPPDPRVFWPPGSGSTSQRYGSGSGSGSFYHHVKIIRNLESNYFMTLFDFLSLKNNVNIPSKSNKILKRKLFMFCFVLFFASIWRSMTKIAGSGSRMRIRIHTKMSWIRNTDCDIM